MIRDLFGSLFVMLLIVPASTYGVENREALWLEKAEIVVRFLPEGSRKIEQRVNVSSETPVEEFRIEHSLFLEDGESIRDLSVSSDDGSTEVDLEGRGLSTVLWVTVRPAGGVGSAEVTYLLELEIEVDDSTRCPLSVPKLVPLDPHNPVRIEVDLPPGQVPSGMVFPKLDVSGDRLVGGMGGVPSFVRVPHGHRKQSWVARNAVDGFILIFIVASTAIWLRSRKTAKVDP
jgi:hypothetical protein